LETGSRGRVLCALVAAAIAAAAGVAATTSPGAAAPGDTTTTTSVSSTSTTVVAAAPPRIEQAASVAQTAKRLRQSGSLPFPMAATLPGEPKSRCLVLNNFGDSRGTRSHEGVDIMGWLGQEVYAVANGTLTRQALDAEAPLSGNAWGLTAEGTNTYYFYGHLSGFAAGLEVGDKVTLGQLIGYVGDTGNANDSGANNYHLHFEVHPGGQSKAAVDPVPLLEIPRACTLYAK
jgi:murein DD-endopeptidase MepM/ murein hydrolase activator NlpD